MAGSKVGRATAFTALWRAVSSARRPGSPGLAARLRVIPRMLGWALTRRYPMLGLGRMAALLLAAVYVVSPIDLVPELVLPVIGVGDDAIVLAWLVGTLLAEAETFLEWDEASRGTSADGDESLGARPDGGPFGAGARTVPGEVLRGEAVHVLRGEAVHAPR